MILVKNLRPTQLVITETTRNSLTLGPLEERRVVGITPAIKDAERLGLVSITETRRVERQIVVRVEIPVVPEKRKRGRPRKVR